MDGSPDLNPLDYSLWAILDKAVQAQKPKNVAELKIAIMRSFRELSQDTVQKAIMQFERRLRLCVAGGGERFEYQMK